MQHIFELFLDVRIAGNSFICPDNIAIVGIVVFLLGFELAFVVSLSLVSEAMPDARGTTMAASNAVGTVARASAAGTTSVSRHSTSFSSKWTVLIPIQA